MEQLIKPIAIIRKPRGWVVAQTLIGERCIDSDLVEVKKGFVVAAAEEAVDKYWPDNSIDALTRKVAYFEKTIEAAKNWKLDSDNWDFETDEDAAECVARLEKKKSLYLKAIQNGGTFN